MAATASRNSRPVKAEGGEFARDQRLDGCVVGEIELLENLVQAGARAPAAGKGVDAAWRGPRVRPGADRGRSRGRLGSRFAISDVKLPIAQSRRMSPVKIARLAWRSGRAGAVKRSVRAAPAHRRWRRRREAAPASASRSSRSFASLEHARAASAAHGDPRPRRRGGCSTHEAAETCALIEPSPAQNGIGASPASARRRAGGIARRVARARRGARWAS